MYQHSNAKRSVRRRRSEVRLGVPQPGREGSTLVVVVSLLALLSVLGITINLYTAQEAESAKFLSEGAKVRTDSGLDPDALFDYGIEQLILGTNIEQSALYGGRHSLLPNMFGGDNHPYSGRGIHVVDLNGDGVPDVDQEYDGSPTTGGSTLLELNDSAAANLNAGVAGGRQNIASIFPHPDPDYTAPDINATWLAFEGWGLDQEGKPVYVVKPSFHGPQYLRQAGNWQPIRHPDTDSNTARHVLRPHARHTIAGQLPSSRRFILDETNPTGIGPEDLNGDGTIEDSADLSTLGVLSGFPFRTHDHGVWRMQQWQAGVAYQIGDWTYPLTPNGLFYQCVGAGTDGSEPTWPTTPGNDDTDGSGATWRAFTQPTYTFDADTDGDGDNESIYLDLGFPVQERGDKTLYVPLFAFQVLDADALGNVNAHSNYAGNVNPHEAGNAFGSVDDGGGMGGRTARFLSRGNQGLTPSEVNLGWILNAAPNTSGDPANDFARLNALFQQTFDGTTDWQEMSNAELFTLLTGIVHADSGGNVEELVSGRYGEATRMLSAWTDVVNGASDVDDIFPYAGTSDADDNGNLGFGEHVLSGWQANTPYLAGRDWVVATLQDNETIPNSATVLLACVGSGTSDNTLTSVNSLSPGHIFTDGSSGPQWMIFTQSLYSLGNPYDIRGTGIRHAADGKTPLLRVVGPNVFPNFRNFGTYGFNKRVLSGLVDFETEFDARSMRTRPHSDEPVEMFWADGDLDGVYPAGNASDAAFAASDAAFLRYSQAVLNSKGTNSRLAKLVAWNLVLNGRAAEIRKRLTPVSWDLRVRGTQGSFGTDEIRGWEFAGNEFPPQFGSGTFAAGASDPLRPAVRTLLRSVVNDPGTNTPAQDVLQRMLSINHCVHPSEAGNDGIHGTADDVASSRPVFSRLTPHPTRIANTAVGLLAPGSMTSDQLQEYGARRDRQLMARDIYVLLYLLGGGWDDSTNANYATGDNSTRELYDDDQLEEMARFAVNLVDQLDPDDVITKFEYDKNLEDGWGVDDNPYGDQLDDTGLPAADRGVVFGVERQTLTLSEALVVQAKESLSGGTEGDHPRTQHYDDEHRDFFFLELHNADATSVGFDNEAWKIVLQKPTFTAASPAPGPPIKTRHLVLLDGSVDGGGKFTIAAAGDDDDYAGNQTDDPPPTSLEVDLDATHDDDFETDIVGGGADLDLILSSHKDRYRIHDANPSITQKIEIADPLLSTGDPGEGQLQFDFDDGTNARGRLLEFADPDSVAQGDALEIVLMRRAHPYRVAPSVGKTSITDMPSNSAPTTGQREESQDNPWIEVDRMTTTVRVFEPGDWGDPDGGAAFASFQNELDNLQSTERSQPLVRDDALSAKASPIRNTIGSINDSTTNSLGGTFDVRQFHPDADFTSAIDLFLVPLFGPHDVTDDQEGMTNETDGYERDAYPNLAGAKKFLKPVAEGAYGTDNLPGDASVDDDGAGLLDGWEERGQGTDDPDPDPAGTAPGSTTWKYDNRWYRLLGVAEAPSPMVDVTDSAEDFAYYRVPGRINWNTLRYPEVLAALLDDDGAFRTSDFTPLQPNAGAKQTSYLSDRDEAAARDWWVQFLLSRDGIDSVSGLVLPGTPDASPFRSPTFVTGEKGNPQGIEQTILRGLPADQDEVRTNVLGRRLFELGTSNQRYGADPPAFDYTDRVGHAVDPETRHRLLSKVWSNSTTRSNVVFVHVQVDFFQVNPNDVPPSTSAGTRIGGKLDDMPTHRGFFVVDRSKAFQLLKPADFSGTGFTFNGPDNGGFDYRNLILYREVIQ